MMERRIIGIAASDGIAIGKAYLLTEPDLSFEKINVTDTDGEISRFNSSLEISKKEIQAIRNRVAETVGEEEAQVFDAHIMVLSDPELIDSIKTNITTNEVNAEQH